MRDDPRYSSAYGVPLLEREPEVGDIVFISAHHAYLGIYAKVVDEGVTTEDWRPGGLGSKLYQAGTEGLLMKPEDPDSDFTEFLWIDDHHTEIWTARVVAEHHPRCAECDQVWPCRKERMAKAAKRKEWAEKNACAHCGKDTGAAWKVERIERTGRTWRIHTRKGPCLTAYRRWKQHGILPAKIIEYEADRPAPQERPTLRLVGAPR